MRPAVGAPLERGGTRHYLYFAAVMNAYNEALKGLGFTSSTETDDTNLHIAVYQNGDDALRVIFRRQGTDITVRMTEV